MSHVAPHRLADLAAGRLLGRRAAGVRMHLDDCAACRQAYERIRSARTAFVEMAGATAPELRWDRIRAQVYWSLGQERGGVPASRRGRAWLALAGVGLAAAAAVAWVSPWGDDGAMPAGAWASVQAATRPELPAPALAAAPAARSALVTLIEGDVDRGAAGELTTPDEIGARLVVAGDRFATGDGRLALQLGPASTVTLGPRSRLTVERLDAAMITLVVDGRLDVELERRAPEQRFVVRGGERTVEVRGTAFRVDRAGGALAVTCEHGRVVVADGGHAVEVGAGQGLRVADDEPLAGRPVRALDEAELAALAAARPSPLGLWTDTETMLATTAPLSLVAPRGKAVRVDGEVIGAGPLWLRKPAGRHLIEVERGTSFGGGRWVVLDGQPQPPVILAEAAPVPAPAAAASAGHRVRKAELERLLDRRRLAACVRSLERQGLAAGTHVDLELGVAATGAVRFLNLADSSLTDQQAGCVRDVVAGVRFGRGPHATWRHRISF